MTKDVKAPTAPAAQGFEAGKGYVKRNIGYPVDSPEKTWHDLTPAQRQDWMRQHEQRWKAKFMAENAQSNLGWTRG